MGAKEVIGIDISPEMIKLAEEKTRQESLDILYLVKDVIGLEKIKEFDIVAAAFLLHYSKTKEEILEMCKSVYKNLKEGGRFVTINQDPVNPIKDLKEFGAVLEGPNPLKEGDKLTVSLYEDMKKTCSFTTYHWSKDTYESCLKKAGFKNIKWSPVEVSKEGIEKHPDRDWGKFTNESYILILEATK